MMGRSIVFPDSGLELREAADGPKAENGAQASDGSAWGTNPSFRSPG